MKDMLDDRIFVDRGIDTGTAALLMNNGGSVQTTGATTHSCTLFF